MSVNENKTGRRIGKDGVSLIHCDKASGRRFLGFFPFVTYMHAAGAKGVETGIRSRLIARAVGIFGIGASRARLESIDQRAIQNLGLMDLILQLTTQFTDGQSGRGR